jgi:hypothetical protein
MFSISEMKWKFLNLNMKLQEIHFCEVGSYSWNGIGSQYWMTALVLFIVLKYKHKVDSVLLCDERPVAQEQMQNAYAVSYQWNVSETWSAQRIMDGMLVRFAGSIKWVCLWKMAPNKWSVWL